MEGNKRLNLGLIAGLLTTVVFIGGCAPAGEEGSPWSTIIFLVLIFAVFYLLLIRPQRRRQKQHEELVKEIRRGDKVITSGGIYGVIESISEDSVVLKVESGATMRVARGSIIGKLERK